VSLLQSASPVKRKAPVISGALGCLRGGRHTSDELGQGGECSEADDVREIVFIEHPSRAVAARPLARHRHVAATDQPHVRDGVMGGANGRVVTNVVRAPVRPATR
jgi:hypothetical protein